MREDRERGPLLEKPKFQIAFKTEARRSALSLGMYIFHFSLEQMYALVKASWRYSRQVIKANPLH